MRIIFFLFLLLICGCKTSNTINQGIPIELDFQKNSKLILQKIEIHLSYTKLNFKYSNTSKPFNQDGNRVEQAISINTNIRLYDNENLKSYKFIKSKGITKLPKAMVINSGESYYFSLIFEKMKNFTKKIDIIECQTNIETNCWNFYNINLENKIVEYFKN